MFGDIVSTYILLDSHQSNHALSFISLYRFNTSFQDSLCITIQFRQETKNIHAHQKKMSTSDITLLCIFVWYPVSLSEENSNHANKFSYFLKRWSGYSLNHIEKPKNIQALSILTQKYRIQLPKLQHLIWGEKAIIFRFQYWIQEKQTKRV